MSPTQALLLLIKPRASRSFLVISPSLYRQLCQQLCQLVPTIPSLPVPIRFGSLFHWLLSSYLLSSATTMKLNNSAATDQSYHTPPLRSKHPIRGTVKQLPDQATADSKESGLETGIIVAAMSDLSYQPSSSEEEELEYESYELPKAKDDIQIHEVTLNHHHLGDCTDLEVGTLICNGETIELHDGSFLKITELRKSRNGDSVTFEGYLFRPVEDLEQYLPATFGGNEVVWLCEAKEHDPKPEGYLRSASSKDVLRIRHLVVANSDYVSKPLLQSQAIGMFTDTRPLICQWMLVAELSKSRCAKNSRSCQSIEKDKGSQRLPKAFIALSSEESIAGGIAAAVFSAPHCPAESYFTCWHISV